MIINNNNLKKILKVNVMNVETMGPNECLQCKWDQKNVE